MGDSSALECLCLLCWGQRPLCVAIYSSKGRELCQCQNDSFGAWAVELGAGSFFKEYDDGLRMDISQWSLPSCCPSHAHSSPLSHGRVQTQLSVCPCFGLINQGAHCLPKLHFQAQFPTPHNMFPKLGSNCNSLFPGSLLPTPSPPRLLNLAHTVHS